MKKAAIIGAGISGLATAYRLVEDGFQVTFFAKDFSPNITSNKAAAFWFPYHVRNDRRGINWCQLSYEKYQHFSSDVLTGISMYPLVKMILEGRDEAEITWIDFARGIVPHPARS